MNSMTMSDLREILIACAGEAETELAADIEDEDFETLGYDSLALMETTARIEQHYGVSIPEERIIELKTPRELLKLVNDGLVGAA